MRIKEKLQHIIKNSLIQLEVSKKLNEIIIEPSADKDVDYYTNIAITLSKDLHKKPEEIAELLKQNINDELINKIEICYPGTLNIYLNRNYIFNGISEIIEKNINYGRSNIGETRRINIDFIDANFCKELDIKHIFNAIYGDNLSRILKYNGFEVTKEYYVNDTSKEIDLLAEKAQQKYNKLCKIENNDEKINIKDTANNIYRLYRNIKLEENTEYFKKEEVSTLLNNKKSDLDKYRINFDTYTSEQSLYDKGLIDTILDKFNKKGFTYFKEDELWLKTTMFDDNKDRVIIKEDGTYTYILPLVAYYIDRLNRKYDGLINIYSCENYEKKQVLLSTLKMLEQDTNKIQIRVLNEIVINNETKEEDINDIRFKCSLQNIKNNIEINLTSISENKKDNINYIEETNNKINKILKQYTKKIKKANIFSTIDNELAYIMLKKLFEFEDIVVISGLKQMPNIICNYLIELVDIFNEYYKEEQIITDDETYTNERLNLLLALKIVINNALDLIGIIPREY